ncbi:MAG: hypothetical protein ACK5LN_13785 [Propioniciclava sp.]
MHTVPEAVQSPRSALVRAATVALTASATTAVTPAGALVIRGQDVAVDGSPVWLPETLARWLSSVTE